MQNHPKVKWSLHCTGILWDFIKKEHPEYIEMVRVMVARGQVELLTGGYYEPILSVICDSDKRGQILKQTAFLKETFGVEAKGMWLAERVWEPGLAKQMAEAGIKYTVVDDAHFAASGMDPESLKGYYVTEDQGVSLNIFPISQQLRYHIPFKTINDTIAYFGANASENGDPVMVMADDGEKFGLWPETYKHVYHDGWLENFLTALEQNSFWLNTVTFSEYMLKFPSSGRVYLPTASYFEMSEWSLPSNTQEIFEDVVKHQGGHTPVKRFLRGGFWRNFLTKYSESNNMHKKMLYVSAKLT
jgi:alpha-amylase/alpha-mannosidase (GH57 family)